MIVSEQTSVKSFIAQSRWFLHEGLRLDASAYATGGLEIQDRIMGRPWCHLDKAAMLHKGPRFSRIYVHDRFRGVPLFSSSDILLADLDTVPTLSKSATPQLNALLIAEGWTLISRSGTIGNTTYVRAEMAGMAASEHVMRAIPNTSVVTPGYLFAFLSTRYGQTLLRRRTYGSIIQHIEPEHIADIPAPLPDSSFQEHIHALVAHAASARTQASRLLDEVAAYFNALAGPMTSRHDHSRAVGIVMRSGLKQRLDAFHHVGWATESTLISGDPIAKLATVISTARVPRVYVKRGVPFLSGIDVFQLSPKVRVRLASHIADAFDARVKKGDLAVQGSGQRYGLLGRAAYIGRRLDGWAASHDLFRIRSTDPAAIARIFAFLRSDAGRRAMLRHSYGTSIPHVNPVGIASVLVPALSSELTDKAMAALELREQADADEERAIQEVEAWLS